ncbi:MAG: endo-1,4-beta-xylanase [Tannerella sp.]|nr:endo-1,4-beta-xylanase [Tannerella sp.]
MKNRNKITGTFLLAISMMVSCVNDMPLTFDVTKPALTADREYLNDYNVLKSYVDRAANTNFKLGSGVSIGDYNAKGVIYRLVSSNFDEITLGYAMKHGAVVQADGSLNLANVSTLLATTKDAGISVFGHTLCWHANQNAVYLNSLITPKIIPGEVEPKWEELTSQDFETDDASNYSYNDNAQTSFTANGEGKDGEGRALKIVNAEVRANDWECQLFVTFPRTVTAGERIRLTMDIKSDINASYSTQAHTAPGAYKHWDFFGTLSSTPQWTTFTKEISVSDDQATSTTIAFNLGLTATTYYFDNIKIEFYNEKPTASGSDLIADFESDALGATYPMSGNSAATVVDDPAGESGKVLNVGGSTPSNQSHPQITLTLPGGRVLGDYLSVTLDFYGTGSTGLYGQGMRMAINDGSLTGYDSPSSFGCPDGGWGRGKIVLPLANLNLTAEQKKMKTFTLVVGSGTGSGNYYIDNITMQWETTGDQIIEKTPEEKAEIIGNALETWIAGMFDACKGSVHAWDVVNEPMSDWPDPSQLKTGVDRTDLTTDEFYWQDYLGKDYAVKAIQFARRYGNVDDKLFINDYGIESNLDKCRGLIEYVKYVESQGVKVDGIGTQMHVTCGETSIETIAESFKLLAATGKWIKISELDMGYRVPGASINLKTDELTEAQQKEMSALYNEIVKTYFTNIPAAQRYGITLWSPTDSPAGSSWRSGEPIGLWTIDYNRKHAYAGVADGLSGK